MRALMKTRYFIFLWLFTPSAFQAAHRRNAYGVCRSLEQEMLEE